MSTSTAPWSDCKVAFPLDDGDPFDDHDLIDAASAGRDLPSGWALDEVDGTGARWVAVFRVAGIPSPRAGRCVLKWLRKIGAVAD